MTGKSEPIQCQNCGHDNLATAKICLVCDSPLVSTSRFQKSKHIRTGLLPPTKEERLDQEQQLINIAKQKYQEKQLLELEEERQQAEQQRNAIDSEVVSSLKMAAKCRDCGYMNRVGDLFCLDCGANLSSKPKKESPTDITQTIKGTNLGDIQAEVEKQKASASLSSIPSQLNVTKPDLKSVEDDVIPDGCFQFTHEMRLQLTEVDSGQSIDLTPNKNKPLLVGRNHESLPIQPEVDLTPFLIEQHGISRRHALIRLRDVRLEIQDLNSTNGTGINGFRFQPKETHQIRNGDIVTLGRVSIKVLFLRKDALQGDNVTEELNG